MPAPKVVLRDIHEYGLDPAEPHSSCRSDGRLTRVQRQVEEPKQLVQAAAKVEMPVEKKIELVTEDLPVVIEKTSVEVEEVPSRSEPEIVPVVTDEPATIVEEKTAEKPLEKKTKAEKKEASKAAAKEAKVDDSSKKID